MKSKKTKRKKKYSAFFEVDSFLIWNFFLSVKVTIKKTRDKLSDTIGELIIADLHSYSYWCSLIYFDLRACNMMSTRKL